MWCTRQTVKHFHENIAHVLDSLDHHVQTYTRKSKRIRLRTGQTGFCLYIAWCANKTMDWTIATLLFDITYFLLFVFWMIDSLRVYKIFSLLSGYLYRWTVVQSTFLVVWLCVTPRRKPTTRRVYLVSFSRQGLLHLVFLKIVKK